MFLKEFCTFSQTLQQPSRENFFKTLSNLGILSTIEIILGLDDDKIRSAAIDIFSYIVEFSPSMVREFIVQETQTQEDDDILINLVIEQMVNDSDPELGGAMQLMGILRLLLDPENMLATASKSEKTEFLTFFYKHSMHVLTAPLFANTADEKPSRDDYQTAQLLSLILELLSFCVEHHTYHIRTYICTRDLLNRVLVLLGSKHAFLVLCALRFMRKIIGLKEEHYYRYIIKGNLFKPIISLFLRNGDRYNLLNSALIELFEFIKVEDIKTLSTHVVENFQKELEGVKYVKTFETLKLRYDQQQDRLKDKMNMEGHTASFLRTSRFRRDIRTLEEEEELWFDQEDEPEDVEGSPPMSDLLKHKLESDLDNIHKIWEHKKAKEQAELKDSPQRLLHKPGPISINLKSGTTTTTIAAAATTTTTTTPLSNIVSGNPCPDSPIPSAAVSRVGIMSQTSSSSSSSSSSISGAAHKPVDQTNTVTKKPGLIGLVDYPDEDSEEEEEEEDEDVVAPSPKRPRIGS